MNNWLIRSLKYLSTVALFSLFVPFITLSHFIINEKSDAAQVLFFTALTVFVGFLGYFSAFLVFHFKEKLPILSLNIIRIVVGIGASAAVAFAFRDSIAFAIIMFILYTIAYSCGGNSFTVNYDGILSRKQFNFTIIVNLITCLVMWFIGLSFSYPYDLSLLAPPFLLFIVAYYLVLNQSNIDELMNRRHHKLSQLPQKIRYYNSFLTLGVLAIIVCGYAFRESIAKLLIWLAQLFAAFLRWIWAIIEWLINLMPTGSEIEIPPAVGGADENPLLDKEKKGGSFWQIYVIIIILLILYVLYRNRKEILTFIIEKLQAFSAFIKRALMKVAVIKRLEQPSEEYLDTVETLSSREKPLAVKDDKISLRRFKKGYQKFLHMESSTEKLRFGYRLILDGLALSGVEIAKSDTTLEIMHKAENAVLALPTATQSYNNVRYGDLPLDFEDMKSVQNTLIQLAMNK